MRRNVRASLSAIAASTLLAFVGPEVGFAAAPAPMPALPPTLPSATGPQEVDVELVLAIDTSGSIDYQEAELQRKGIAEAFLSKDVIQAIQWNPALGDEFREGQRVLVKLPAANVQLLAVV